MRCALTNRHLAVTHVLTLVANLKLLMVARNRSRAYSKSQDVGNSMGTTAYDIEPSTVVALSKAY